MADDTDYESMTDAEFAQAMVTKYRNALAKSPGMTSVELDGQKVSFNDLEKTYEFWSKKLARLNGTRPPLLSLDMSQAS